MSRSASVMLLSCWLVASTTSAGKHQASCVSLEGDPFTARLVDLDDGWKFTFAEGAKEREIPGQRLVSWGAYADDDRGPQILFADGSLLVADVVAIRDESLTVYSDIFGELILSLEHVAGIVFDPQIDALKRDLFADRLLSTTGSQDRLILTNGDVVHGLLTEKATLGPQSANQVLEKIYFGCDRLMSQ